ncbi:MAG TPA: hypothetical protein VJ805_12545 [Nitrospiraceae bacterium]|nr:hypothetical protein [Nitrospiraceae bacterium]
MSAKQAFWDVSTKQGEPDLWVCMSCLNEVFFRKVPMPDCPTCHGVSTYEAFTLDAVRDWGTEELIAKAQAAQVKPEPPQPEAAAATPIERVS